MADPIPPGDGLAPLIAELRDLRRQLRELQKPTGTQVQDTATTASATLNYLAGLKKLSVGTASYNSGDIPNDGVIRWYTSPTPLSITVAIPTRTVIVTVEAGEASIVGGQIAQAFAGFRVSAANGLTVPGTGLGAITGRLYVANLRLGARIATPAKPVIITDPMSYPGPYTIEGFFGVWAAASNTVAMNVQFNDLAMTVEVIGNGVY